MTPRLGRHTGYENVTITGVFPTNVPVYVWFGTQGISTAHFNNGTDLIVATPAVSAPTVTDVIVKFSTDRSYEMTLAEAFTFYEAASGGGGGSVSYGQSLPGSRR